MLSWHFFVMLQYKNCCIGSPVIMSHVRACLDLLHCKLKAQFTILPNDPLPVLYDMHTSITELACFNEHNKIGSQRCWYGVRGYLKPLVSSFLGPNSHFWCTRISGQKIMLEYMDNISHAPCSFFKLHIFSHNCYLMCFHRFKFCQNCLNGLTKLWASSVC